MLQGSNFLPLTNLHPSRSSFSSSSSFPMVSLSVRFVCKLTLLSNIYKRWLYVTIAMHTKITTSLLLIFAIVIAISLVTATSLLANPVLAVKHSSKKGTSSSTSGGTTTLGSTSSSSGRSSTSTTGGSTSSYDKFLSCITPLRAKLTKTDVDNCYSTAYAGNSSSSSGSSLGSSSSGSSTGSTSTSGSSA